MQEFQTESAQTRDVSALNPPQGIYLLLLSLFTFCVTFVPILLYYRRFHLNAVFFFLANDAFYYLDVARYSHGFRFFSFDGIHPTNGFHPLWQFCLYYVSRISPFSIQSPLGLRYLFLLNAVIVSAGYGLLSLFIAKQVHRSWLAPLAVCPGLTWFFVAIADSNYLSSWAYMNGMETALSLILFGAVLLFFGREMPDDWRLVVGSIVLGFAVLARLDDVFFLLAFAGYSIFRASQNRVRVALAYLPPFAMIAAYMLYNHRTVGPFLPVSGAAKAGFALPGNLHSTCSFFLPVFWDSNPNPVSLSVSGELTMRLVQLWLPILVCGTFLFLGLRRRSLQARPVVACLCVGAVLKGLYNLCFVAVWLQGNWYYAISIFTSNVVLALALDHFLSRTLGKRPFASTPVRYAVILPLIALSSWYCFSGIVSHKAAQHFGQENAEIYAHGAEIAREIHSLGATSYLELEDGEIAFATSMPSVSGFGLALDPEAANAKKEGHFLNLMEGRGIHFIVAGGLYQYVLNVSLADPSPAFNGMKASEFTGYSIQPVLEDRAANVTIYRIVKRDKKPADAPIILSGLNHGKTS